MGIELGVAGGWFSKRLVETGCFERLWAVDMYGDHHDTDQYIKAERRLALPTYTDVPFPGHTFSAQDLRAELETQGYGPLKITRFPWWVMTVAAPFWELAREFREMRYLYNHAHSLDGELFDTLLPDFQKTKFSKVILAEMPG